MANNLAKPSEPMLPGMMQDLDMRRLVDSFQLEAIGHEILIDRLPHKNECDAMRRRAQNLQASLRPVVEASAEQITVRQNLSVLFSGYGQMRMEEDQGSIVDAYLMVLDKYPLFAVLEALKDVAHNRVPGLNPDRPPTSARMAQLAGGHMAKVAAEHQKIGKVLSAKRLIQPPEVEGCQARIAASLKDFHGRMNSGELAFGTMTDEDRKRTSERHKADNRRMVIREWDAMGIAPPMTSRGDPISVALARKTGLLQGPPGFETITRGQSRE